LGVSINDVNCLNDNGWKIMIGWVVWIIFLMILLELIDFFAINQSKMLVSDINDENNDTTGKEFVSIFIYEIST
jgi:hypothetical protein